MKRIGAYHPRCGTPSFLDLGQELRSYVLERRSPRSEIGIELPIHIFVPALPWPRLPSSTVTTLADAAKPMIARARGLTTPLVPLGERARKAIRAAWLCVVVAAGVLLVVVPVGYAAGGNHVQVERAAGYGLVVAIGILLRTHRSGRAWLGLLIGSVVGLTTNQILVNLPPGIQGELTTLAPAMALTLAMIDGFGERRLRGYRDAIREAAIVRSWRLGSCCQRRRSSADSSARAPMGGATPGHRPG